MSFDNFISPYNLHFNQENYSISPHALFPSIALPTQRRPLFWFLSPQIRLGSPWTSHRWNHTYVVFMVWILLLNLIIFETHPVCCFSQWLISFYCWMILYFTNIYHNFFIHFPIDEHLICCQFLIMNKAGKDILVIRFFMTYSLVSFE